MTILGQLPFTLFTEIAQRWVVQRDNVNTAIIHSYSTWSRGGRYDVRTVCTSSQLPNVHDGRGTAWHCSRRRSPQHIYVQSGLIALNVVKHVFRYLVDTKDQGILFGSKKNLSEVGYTDSDFAGCVDNWKSTTRYYFKFGNGAISWMSKLYECTTTSTTEVEYVAASDAAKEALWLGRLPDTFRQVDSDSAPIVYNDSQGVVALSKNPVHHNASKHIDIRYHFVRDCVISGKIGLENMSTTDNVAGGMTKCLSTDRFWSLRHQVGVMKNRSG